jgi:hypothetical protein
MPSYSFMQPGEWLRGKVPSGNAPAGSLAIYLGIDDMAGIIAVGACGEMGFPGGEEEVVKAHPSDEEKAQVLNAISKIGTSKIPHIEAFVSIMDQVS